MYPKHYKAQILASDAKLTNFKTRPVGYAAASALAGFFIGLGFLFSQMVKMQLADSPVAIGPLASSFVFALGLVLVFFAGAELFTGNNLAFGLALFEKRHKTIHIVQVLAYAWVFNLLGSLILALVFRVTHAGGAAMDAQVLSTVISKIDLTIPEMITRGILCNIFVCLAVWGAGAFTNEAAKTTFAIFNVAAFVLLGLEHCVANMTIFSYALLFSQADQMALVGRTIGLGGILNNLLWVTIGNLIGGIIFVALPYYLTSKEKVS